MILQFHYSILKRLCAYICSDLGKSYRLVLSSHMPFEPAIFFFLLGNELLSEDEDGSNKDWFNVTLTGSSTSSNVLSQTRAILLARLRIPPRISPGTFLYAAVVLPL